MAEAVAVLAVVHRSLYLRPPISAPVIFMVVPAILFATVRFGLVGATVATLVIALIANGFVVMGIGEPLLSRPELSDRILALQDHPGLYIAVVAADRRVADRTRPPIG